ncbi:MAG TPA: CoA transferase [Tepidiformaceae bacterium]|nr:CoA transferase [Tepidiformaceae bacterium]
MNELPLEGVRVLEVAPGYAAGFAGRLLAGFGADVAVAGDPSAELTPDELVFLTSGKRRVTGASPGDLRRLALAADIVLDDQKPGTLASVGLAPDGLRRENPALIVVSITPFGQRGPYADWGATNITAFSMGGIVSLTGHPSREPLVTGGSQAYALGGLNAFSATVTAYYGRLVHGEGDWIDISLQECSAGMLELYGPGSAATDVGPSPRRGNHVRAVWGIYPCADGWAGVCCLERQVPAFFKLLDDPVLEEERFRDPFQRAEQDDELSAMVYAWFADKTKAEILALGPKTRVPFGAVMTPGDLLANESLAERGFFDAVPTPDGEARIPGRPFPGVLWRAPQLHDSEDAESLLRDWSAERVRA